MDWLDLLTVQGTLKSSPTPQFLAQTTCLYSRQLFGYLLARSFPFPSTLPPPHSDTPSLCVCPGGVIPSSHLPIKYILAFLPLCTVWTAPYASFLRGLFHSPLGSLRLSWASLGEPRAFFPPLVLLVRMCSPGPLLNNSPWFYQGRESPTDYLSHYYQHHLMLGA